MIEHLLDALLDICNDEESIKLPKIRVKKGDFILVEKEKIEKMLEEKMERWEYLNELADKIEKQKTR